jgi:signal transduction histidine kinase
LRRKNGTFIPIDARVGVCILRGKPLYLAQTRDMTTHLRNEERLRALTAQLMTAREEERRQIALELHDDFTQKLAVIGMEIDLMRQSAACDPEASAALERIRTSIISLTDQMRELSHQYHPGMLEHAGLESAAAAHCQDVTRYSGIPVSLHVRDLPDRLPLEVSLTLYRILQEALRNVVRHSGSDAAYVFISGLTDPPRVTLVVVDHGKGFLIEDIRDGSGLGLLGIEERTRLVRGVLKLSSIPGEGTRLEVEIPLPSRDLRAPPGDGKEPAL